MTLQEALTTQLPFKLPAWNVWLVAEDNELFWEANKLRAVHLTVSELTATTWHVRDWVPVTRAQFDAAWEASWASLSEDKPFRESVAKELGL